MGLGKSAQVVTACDLIGAKRVLIICPASARVNWLREFSKFSIRFNDEDFTVVMGAKHPIPPGSSIICSYDFAGGGDTAGKIVGDFDVLIIDECHYLKSPTAKRTKSILGKMGLIRKARRVWAISGTPAPNNASELWPLLYTFGVVKLGYDLFVERYCTHYMGNHGRVITGTNTKAIPELKQILNQVMLRRLKKDVMKELPPIYYTDIVVPAGEVDLEINPSFTKYIFPEDKRKELDEKLAAERAVVDAAWAIMEKAQAVKQTTNEHRLRSLEGMAQSVSTLRRYVGLQKVEAAADLIAQELESGAIDKIVIFAIHRDVIENMRVKLSKFGAVTLYGGTDPGTKVKNIDKFQRNPKCRVFIGNIEAAGTAITLTAACHVTFIEMDWRPGLNSQAAMRCHRIGQTRPVHVRIIALENSYDEKVSAVLKKKLIQLTKLFDEPLLHDQKQGASVFAETKLHNKKDNGDQGND